MAITFLGRQAQSAISGDWSSAYPYHWVPPARSYNTDCLINAPITVTAKSVPGVMVRSLSVSGGATLTFDDSYPSNLSIDTLTVSGASTVNVGTLTTLRINRLSVYAGSSFRLRANSTVIAHNVDVQSYSTFYNTGAFISADNFVADTNSSVGIAGGIVTMNVGALLINGAAVFAMDANSGLATINGSVIFGRFTCFEITASGNARVNVGTDATFSLAAPVGRWTSGAGVVPAANMTFVYAGGHIYNIYQARFPVVNTLWDGFIQ